VAWAGEGLPLEPAGDTLPAAGSWSGESHGTATLAAIVPLPGGSRGWRVMAGRSLSSARAPFDLAGLDAASVRWTIRRPGEPLRAGAKLLSVPGAPELVWTSATAAAATFGPRAARWAQALVGLTLLALAAMRAVGLMLLAGTVVRDPGRGVEVSLLTASGAGLTGARRGCAAALGGALLAATVRRGGARSAAVQNCRRSPHWSRAAPPAGC
jgi:hypothetical protein